MAWLCRHTGWSGAQHEGCVCTSPGSLRGLGTSEPWRSSWWGWGPPATGSASGGWSLKAWTPAPMGAPQKGCPRPLEARAQEFMCDVGPLPGVGPCLGAWWGSGPSQSRWEQQVEALGAWQPQARGKLTLRIVDARWLLKDPEGRELLRCMTPLENPTLGPNFGEGSRGGHFSSSINHEYLSLLL